MLWAASVCRSHVVVVSSTTLHCACSFQVVHRDLAARNVRMSCAVLTSQHHSASRVSSISISMYEVIPCGLIEFSVNRNEVCR
jgi:hypothetical protein